MINPCELNQLKRACLAFFIDIDLYQTVSLNRIFFVGRKYDAERFCYHQYYI